MPGTNAGTGIPFTLRCRPCNRAVSYIYRTGRTGRNLTATGRTRPLAPAMIGHGGPRLTGRQIEYRCLDCGHLGWSRHRDAEFLLANIRGRHANN